MSLVFSKNAGDGGQTPVLVWLMKFRRSNACRVKGITQHFEASLVANRQMDVRGMVIGGATILVGMFNGGVGSLNGLLREWDIAARNGIQVSFEVLQLHGVLQD